MYQEEKVCKIPRCFKCNNLIEYDLIEYRGRSFHEKCFDKFFKKIRFEIKIFGFSCCI